MGLDVPLTPGYQAPFWVGGEEGLGSHSAQIQSLSVLGEPAQVTRALQASVLTPGRWESKVAQSCLTLCDPMGCSLPGSSVHGIFQARVLEWGAISFSRRSSRPRDRTRSAALQTDALTPEPPGKHYRYTYIPSLVNLPPLSLPIPPL